MVKHLNITRKQKKFLTKKSKEKKKRKKAGDQHANLQLVKYDPPQPLALSESKQVFVTPYVSSPNRKQSKEKKQIDLTPVVTNKVVIKDETRRVAKVYTLVTDTVPVEVDLW